MKKKWILKNIHMINSLFNKLIIFIQNNNNDFRLINNEYTFYKNFYRFLYNNYIIKKNNNNKINFDNNLDYFETMYCSDIIELFNEFKEISYGFTNNIFNNINDSYDLINFIYLNIELLDDYNECDNLLKEDIYDEYDDYYFRL
jgi:hypothetical protein